MNKNILLTIVGFFTIAAVINESHAHDPAKHTEKAEKPNCEAMKLMKPNGDANDPVYLAMMLKCENAVLSAGNERSSSDAEQSAPRNDISHDHERNSHQN